MVLTYRVMCGNIEVDNLNMKGQVMKYTITITENQANTILNALENESVDEPAQFGEYSYGRCYREIKNKLIKAGW